MNVATALSSAAEILQKAGITEFRKEAASLLAAVLHKNTAFFIAHPEFELSDDASSIFNIYISRRAQREPFQYIVGHQEFYGLEFEVSPDVLVPRPETEILVEQAINVLSGLENPRFCEAGVGSGCISVSILKNVNSAFAIATDISVGALQIARRNAEKYKVGGRLTLHQGDVFGNVKGPFDLIVSNPPYIPAQDIDSLQIEVRDHEPHSALDGGADGLAILEQIIQQSPTLLKKQGTLLLEIGFDQAEKIRPLFDKEIWSEPEFLPDLQGIPRIVKAEKIAK
jgi:release factor glutamine methyltransferase